MNRVKALIIIVFLIFGAEQKAYASSGVSCNGEVSLLNSLLANITTLGLFSSFVANFEMYGSNAGDKSLVCDANYYFDQPHLSVTCPNPPGSCEASCSQAGVTLSTSSCQPCNSKGGVKICFNNLQPDNTMAYNCYWATDGWGPVTYFNPPASLRVVSGGDNICAQFWTPVGWEDVGCKYLPQCSYFSLSTPCYVSESCYTSASNKSRTILPIAGTIIQCISDSIAMLFYSQAGCGSAGGYTINYISVFQKNLRGAVRAALMLYMVLFGIKIVLSGEVVSKGELAVFTAKFILVNYFSVGLITGHDSHGDPIYTDGVTQLIYPFFNTASSALATMIFEAGGSTGLCKYPLDNLPYPTGYEYLALWDSIDCRILHYIGFNQSAVGTLITGGVDLAILAILIAMGGPTLLLLLLPALLSFQIMFLLFTIIFALLFISVVIYFVNIVVIAMIAMNLLIYMAPIFVPMALFEQTKQYYDGWLKLVISYCLQPMIVAAYMAMMLTVFDQVIFGNCTFAASSINLGTSSTKPVAMYLLCDPTCPWSSKCPAPDTTSGLTSCTDTIGYNISPPYLSAGSGCPTANNMTNTINAIFFDFVQLNPAYATKMFNGLITLALFGFLFYKFAELLGSFAAEVTGGTNIGGLAGNPMGAFNKMMAAAMMAAKLANAAMKARKGKSSGANSFSNRPGGANASVTSTKPGDNK